MILCWRERAALKPKLKVDFSVLGKRVAIAIVVAREGRGVSPQLRSGKTRNFPNFH